MLPSLPSLRRAVLLLPLLLGSLAARAQPEPIKFGKPDPKDFQAAAFLADSTAPAVVLCDYGRSRLEGFRAGFRVVFERVTRIKILRKAGYDEATITIPLYHTLEDQEKVSNLRGFTYNMVNGVLQKTKLEPGSIFLEKSTDKVNVQKFTLPDVREGSVIEYAYTLTSDFLFNFQDWAFQRRIPVRWSEYRSSIPVFYKYKIIYQGPLGAFAVNEAKVGSTTLMVDNKLSSGAGLAAGQTNGSLSISAPTEEHQWVMKNVPTFHDEPYMTTEDDYISRLDFQLIGEQWPEQPYRDLTGSWEKINQTLLADDDFGQQMKRGGFLKEQMQALAAQHPEVGARTAAVRQAVMSAVRYDGTNRYAAPNSLRKAYEAHRGTAAEVNLLLIAALREAGLPAQPVLLSTRSHGLVNKEFPLLEKFNYVVALVLLSDGKELLVDATDPTLPCGMLPQRCLNQHGRLITAKPEDGRWISLLPSQRHTHYQQVQLTLDAQGGLAGSVHEEFGGYAAADARDELSQTGEKKYWAELARQHSSWSLPKTTISQRDDTAKPLLLDYSFAQPAEESRAPGTLYLSPLAAFGPSQNRFRHESRTFAVDFGMLQDEATLVTLTLPSGYALAEVPKAAVIDLPDGGGRFVYSATTTGATVQLTSRLTLRKAIYSAEEYQHLRELYRLMLEKQASQLEIKKQG
jgi:hypothetical protein